MSRSLDNGSVKFWQKEVVARSCRVRVSSEFDEQDKALPPEQPKRTLSKGAVITVSGGDSTIFYVRLGPDQLKKLGIPRTEVAKIQVV